MENDHMQLPERPPSYSQSHDPQSIYLPPAPKPEPSQVRGDRSQPRLSPPAADPIQKPQEVVDHSYQQAPYWPSSNPLSAYYQPSALQASPTNRSTAAVDSPSTIDNDGANSDGHSRRAGSVLSMDDPDVRIAAEALGDLRADFVSSPPQQHSSLPASSPRSFQHGRTTAQQPEPLLSLLTTSHPLIGTAIGGSLNAYSASKNYSPRFKSGVEYIEKRFTPVVNTVGSVGRVTGVEGGVRWFLGGRRPSHQSSGHDNSDHGSNKRRKVGDSEMDIDNHVSRDPYPVHRQEFQLHRERRESQTSTVESLPAYDEQRSPSYEAHPEQSLITTQHSGSPTSPGSTWHSRLVLSTSGLSIAMSEESLRSLKYCLSWLRWANEHIGKVILALKSVLQQFEGAPQSTLTGALMNGDGKGESPNGQLIMRTDVDRSAITAKVAELKSEILKTLKDVVDVVSKYAGGALPENARTLVRRHLTSLPQRFRLASTTQKNGRSAADRNGEVIEGARKVILLAKEGLDMMAQVSGVLDGTIVSAEEWCERLGKKRRGEAEGDDTGALKES